MEVEQLQSEQRVKMTLLNFIKENHRILDEYIQNLSSGTPRNDEERRFWILNNEDLYNWARSQGVKI